MGLSSSKTTSKTGYGKDALPKIQGATSAVENAYSAAQPDINNVTAALRTTFGGYGPSNPNLDAAGGYVSDVLGGKYLTAGNPYIERMIADTGDSVSDRVNALFSKSGQTGSSRQIGELGKQLASAENGLRYQNYGDEMNRMSSAVGMATGLNDANNGNVATQLALGQGLTGIGTDAADQYAQAIASLWGNNLDTKGKTKGSVIGGLGGLLSSGAAAYSAFK
jgi:hypothetical protein